MCEHNDQLKRAAYALKEMSGTGIYDMPRLRQLLNDNTKPCNDHEGDQSVQPNHATTTT